MNPGGTLFIADIVSYILPKLKFIRKSRYLYKSFKNRVLGCIFIIGTSIANYVQIKFEFELLEDIKKWVKL